MSIYEQKKNILVLSEPEKAKIPDIVILMSTPNSCSAELSMKKVLLPRG